MTEQEEIRAKEILKKEPKLWSKEENAFLYRLIKEGNRERLKNLRTEALLT